MNILWILGSLGIWFIIGCGVLAFIDDNQMLFKWASSCPIPFGYELTVMAWPIILFIWMRKSHDH